MLLEDEKNRLMRKETYDRLVNRSSYISNCENLYYI